MATCNNGSRHIRIYRPEAPRRPRHCARGKSTGKRGKCPIVRYWRVWTAWLLDVYRVRLEFPELRRRIQLQCARWDAKLILIEEAGSGIQLLQDLKRQATISVRGLVPKDDKATRLLSIVHLVEGGQIAVPEDAPWLAEFQREVSLFPNGKHDDQVDSMTQFLRWLAEPKAVPRIRFL